MLALTLVAALVANTSGYSSMVPALNNPPPDRCQGAHAALIFAQAARLPHYAAQDVRFRIETGGRALPLSDAVVKLCAMPKPLMCDLSTDNSVLVLQCRKDNDDSYTSLAFENARGFLDYMYDHTITERPSIAVRGVADQVILDAPDFGQMLRDYVFLFLMNSNLRLAVASEEVEYGAKWIFEPRHSTDQ